ncbi:unnamed protein product [Fraxinus pennsylvanica]|uniref:protein-histidine N-methyltransferase n=1 Tax=Fraxinus pennsylvanica TaxID=56036 RepID=A0AAD1ZLA1_9LAMI|nr:unnamed protein product [Fraxinus pennsylvanica]
MDSNQSNSQQETNFRLFDAKPTSGFGFFDLPEKPLPPPPPCLEVVPSEVSSNVKYTVEPVNVDGLTLLKGRVSTQEVFALSNSDLVPGKYEGGLKLWEGSIDLIKALSSDMQDGKLSFGGKRILELGCGHGLPGIFACLKGAATVHFQDFNAEVLQHLTIPNVKANIQKKSQYLTDVNECSSIEADTRFFAETVYSISALPSLFKLIKKCGNRPHGVVYMAAKKHYFGVGGGSRRFISMVEKDGAFASSLVSEVADGSSNVREVWKLSLK